MGRKQKHPIHLSAAEREQLEAIARGGENKVRVARRAQMLLWSDEGKSDLEIAELLAMDASAVANTRQRWVTKHHLMDEARSGRPPLMDGKQEAFLVALACSESPTGMEQWSLRLLADKLLELNVVDARISKDTVGRSLKKTNSSRG